MTLARTVHPQDDVMAGRVYVAEDDNELRRAIADDFVRAGVSVTELVDGLALLRRVEAVAAGSATAPDAIVADIRMPGCSGFVVLGAMRRLQLRVPVVLITAFGDARTHALAGQLGAAAVLDKPFDLLTLRELVKTLCD
jgi:DNA-binding response OmpR family regulator